VSGGVGGMNRIVPTGRWDHQHQTQSARGEHSPRADSPLGVRLLLGLVRGGLTGPPGRMTNKLPGRRNIVLPQSGELNPTRETHTHEVCKAWTG